VEVHRVSHFWSSRLRSLCTWREPTEREKFPTAESRGLEPDPPSMAGRPRRSKRRVNHGVLHAVETRDGGTVLLAEWPAAHRHACAGHLGTSRTRRAPYCAPVSMRYRTPRPRHTCTIHRKWHPLPPPRVAAPGVGDPHSPRHLGVRVDGVTGCERAPFTRSAMAVPRFPRDLHGLGSDL